MLLFDLIGLAIIYHVTVGIVDDINQVCLHFRAYVCMHTAEI